MFDPSGDIPRGESGEWPGNCEYCEVGQIYWEETGGANIAVKIGPLILTLLEKQGEMIVNECDQCGRLISSMSAPSTPLELAMNPAIDVDPDVENWARAHFDISYFFEWRASNPW